MRMREETIPVSETVAGRSRGAGQKTEAWNKRGTSNQSAGFFSGGYADKAKREIPSIAGEETASIQKREQIALFFVWVQAANIPCKNTNAQHTKYLFKKRKTGKLSAYLV